MKKPSFNLNVDGVMLVGLGVGLPLLIYTAVKIGGAKKAVAAGIDKINPASSNNFVNQGVESIGAKLTGDKDFTLGGWAYDWSHNDDGSLDKAGMGWDILGVLGSSPIPMYSTGAKAATVAKKVVPYVNPANPNNLVNQAVTRTVGEDNLAAGADYFFAGIDLINPFNKSDDYAKKVWGIEK